MDERFKEVDLLTERKVCPKCEKKRLYFCYDCVDYMPGVSSMSPSIVQLSVQIDIIKHERELNGKSTAIHCALLAPEQTKIFTPNDSNIPNYSKELEEINTAFVYPDKDAISIEEFVKQSKRPVQRLVFLDAVWSDIPKLKRAVRLENVPKVRLNAYQTQYWRPQKGYSDECLATIEAIFYAIKEVWQAQNPKEEYNGQFDDLLFWFQYFKTKFINSKEKIVK